MRRSLGERLGLLVLRLCPPGGIRLGGNTHHLFVPPPCSVAEFLHSVQFLLRPLRRLQRLPLEQRSIRLWSRVISFALQRLGQFLRGSTLLWLRRQHALDDSIQRSVHPRVHLPG